MSYALPYATRVRISVYNLQGKRLKTLVDAQQVAGHHIASWEGRSDDGTTAGSGVYVVQMTAGRLNATHKIVLVR
ncbi:MAG: T9SS type A sorting domain-containing protein [Calditrichaeota bacterium]|nr:T9SS type A sorting domain-containing protein [Calditrichota bacterium]